LRHDGFTLIEVLVTLLITSIMLSAIYMSFVSTVAAKQYSEQVKEAGRTGQAILSLMRRDFEGAMIFSLGEPAMIGKSGSVGSAGADAVDFVTTSDSRRAVDGRGSDYNEVGYMAYAGEEQNGLLSLYRREDFFLDQSPFEGGVLELLDDGVKGLTLEYLTVSGWVSEWQGEGLPEAVRITLVLRKKTGQTKSGQPAMRDYTYSTIAFVPAGKKW
jgi:prepilin-type N-terminal cleavage/methylation domain-containing protein